MQRCTRSPLDAANPQFATNVKVRENPKFDSKAMGIDAQHADHGLVAPDLLEKVKTVVEQQIIDPAAKTMGRQFVAGDSPTQVLDWAVEAVAKSSGA